MSKESEAIEAKVDALLKEAGKTYEARLMGERNIEGRVQDHWFVTFREGPKSSVSFDFYTGIGCREVPKGLQAQHRLLAAKTFVYARSIAAEENRKARAALHRPVDPKAAGVLYCLLNEAYALDNNFQDWASDYGYDSDSIKALGVYNECCENGRRLRMFLGHPLFYDLRVVVEGY